LSAAEILDVNVQHAPALRALEYMRNAVRVVVRTCFVV